MTSATINHSLPRHERINKICDSCGVRIYFTRNTNGKLVPFDMGTRRCHYETCLTPPNPNGKPYEKPKVKYKTIENNTLLNNFIEVLI